MKNEKRLTFRLLFYIKRTALRRDGRAPLMLRITVDGLSAQMSLQIAVPPSGWLPAVGRMAGRSAEAREVNLLLSDVAARARQLYYGAVLGGNRPDACRLRDALQGRVWRLGFLDLFRRHVADFGERVGHGRSQSTYRKYAIALSWTERFVRGEYGRADVETDSVDEVFACRLVTFLLARGLAPGTVRLYVSAVRTVTLSVWRRGLLPADPFRGNCLPVVPARREALTEGEVERLARLPLAGRAARVRNLFLLSCRTGLAYADLCGLRPCHVHWDASGAGWIVKPRAKNGRQAAVRLVPEAERLLAACCPEGFPETGLFMPDNRTCNRMLKRLAAQAGLARRLYFHLARHTFATLSLSAGVPIESVSLMLGHSRLSTTQIYARVTTEKLRRDTECLLSGRFQ